MPACVAMFLNDYCRFVPARHPELTVSLRAAATYLEPNGGWLGNLQG
jgi:hypothetical protein